MKLKDQTALITGASRGIGEAIARAFAAEGAHLAITGRSGPELGALKKEFSSLGVQCRIIVGDLMESGAVEEVWRQATESFGHIDILVNNAGIGSSESLKLVMDYDDAFWKRMLHLNLTVPYFFSKRALPSMINRKHGRILMTASVIGKTGMSHGAAYAASKHGLLGLMRTLAIETARHGITVNAVCPGPVRTRMLMPRLEHEAGRLGKTVAELEAAWTPIGRLVEPDEIGPLAVYLASREASAVTGQAFNIDGGLLMV